MVPLLRGKIALGRAALHDAKWRQMLNEPYLLLSKPHLAPHE